MRKLKLTVVAALVIGFIGCKKDLADKNPSLTSNAETCIEAPAELLATASTTPPYNFQVVSRTPVDGGYRWVWKVTKVGTAQDISHWNLLLPECLQFSDILSMGYSYDGQTFQSLTPSLQGDPSLGAGQFTCGNLSQYCVVKFDKGHEGKAAIYYSIVISENLMPGQMNIIYKSGVNTGCGLAKVPGFGCAVGASRVCALSQGYFFASPHSWEGKSLTIGGHTYTEADAKAIWNTSNAGGIAECKQAFHQGGAILLSMQKYSYDLEDYPTEVQNAMKAIEDYLSSGIKLKPASTTVNKKTVMVVNCSSLNASLAAAAASAAGFLGTWIAENHCE